MFHRGHELDDQGIAIHVMAHPSVFPNAAALRVYLSKTTFGDTPENEVLLIRATGQ